MTTREQDIAIFDSIPCKRCQKQQRPAGYVVIFDKLGVTDVKNGNIFRLPLLFLTTTGKTMPNMTTMWRHHPGSRRISFSGSSTNDNLTAWTQKSRPM